MIETLLSATEAYPKDRKCFTIRGNLNLVIVKPIKGVVVRGNLNLIIKKKV